MAWMDDLVYFNCSPSVHLEYVAGGADKTKPKSLTPRPASAAEMKHLGAEGMIARAHITGRLDDACRGCVYRAAVPVWSDMSAHPGCQGPRRIKLNAIGWSAPTHGTLRGTLSLEPTTHGARNPRITRGKRRHSGHPGVSARGCAWFQ